MMQKVSGSTFPEGHSGSSVCRYTVSGTISPSLSDCFSPFPHGTSSLSVSSECLVLDGGPPRFPQDFKCPVVLRNVLTIIVNFVYGSITLSAPVSQLCSTINFEFALLYALQPLRSRSILGLDCSQFARTTTGISNDFSSSRY